MFLIFLSLAQVTSALVSCNVKDFGATGDGITYEDDAFANALLACSNLNNCIPGEIGRVFVPPGKYLLSPFNLTSNMELHLDIGSVLLPTTDFSKWSLISEFPSYPDNVSFFSCCTTCNCSL